LILSAAPVELRVVSVGGFGLRDVSIYTQKHKNAKTYPIHCSTGGKPGGLIADNGDSLKCFNSSGVYLIAMTAMIFDLVVVILR
jgi:hypothetical protein